MHLSIPYYAFMFLWLFIEFPLCCVGQNDPLTMCLSFDVCVWVRNSFLYNKNFAFSPQQFYVIRFIEYDILGLQNGMSTRDPNFVGFWIINIAYEDPFNGFILTLSLYCFGNEGPTFASIGAEPINLRFASLKSFVGWFFNLTVQNVVLNEVDSMYGWHPEFVQEISIMLECECTFL